MYLHTLLANIKLQILSKKAKENRKYTKNVNGHL